MVENERIQEQASGGVSRRAIISADDFGLSEAVNEGIERAHRAGILSTASLMVAGPAAADAVRRARRLPGLNVGLHLVLVEGAAALPPSDIPLLVAQDGQFASDQTRLGVRYFLAPGARRQLRAEIAAQFRAFAATGLRLDHANAHKHMHLHPTVGRLLLEEGRTHALPAVRVPEEPAAVLAHLGEPPGAGARLLALWTRLLRAQCRRAGVRTNRWCFGIKWSGHMRAERVARLAARLPPGLSEIYFHPASHRDALFTRLMPGYEPEAELAALLDPGVRHAFEAAGCAFVTWSAAAIPLVEAHR
jgi:hopanoid biosynthesis associated protein HpnK